MEPPIPLVMGGFLLCNGWVIESHGSCSGSGFDQVYCTGELRKRALNRHWNRLRYMREVLSDQREEALKF
jgi:hypothetical protein